MAFNPAGTVTLRPSSSDPLDNPQTAGVLSVNAASVIPATFFAGSVTNTITARAGGGQSLATPLTTQINRITVCATGADSVLLPSAAPIGTEVLVRNDGAQSAQVFAANPATINAAATGTGVALAANSSARYTRVSATAWYT
jgi:hypothetical protein